MRLRVVRGSCFRMRGQRLCGIAPEIASGNFCAEIKKARVELTRTFGCEGVPLLSNHRPRMHSLARARQLSPNVPIGPTILVFALLLFLAQ